MLSFLGNASGSTILILLLMAYLAGVGTKDYVVWAIERVRVLYDRWYGRKFDES